MSAAADMLTPERRERLARLAEAIVPRGRGMPSADDIGLVDLPVERVLKVRPDLAGPLAELLDDWAEGAAEDFLAALSEKEPDRFLLLMQAVAGAYYMDAQVRDLIGYPGQQALSLPRAGFGAEELAVEMMGRPPRYRDPDQGPA